MIEFLSELTKTRFKQYLYFDSAVHGALDNWKKLHPEIEWTSGMPSEIRGEICDLWNEPNELPNIHPIPEDTIKSKLKAFEFNTLKQLSSDNFDASKLLLPDKSIIFFPAISNERFNIRSNLWDELGRQCKRKGYSTYTNVTGMAHYQERNVLGSEALTMDHRTLAMLAILNPCAKLIMMRSGATDFLRLFCNHTLIFYPSDPLWYWGKCRMKHVKYSQSEATEILLDPKHPITETFVQAILQEFD